MVKNDKSKKDDDIVINQSQIINITNSEEAKSDLNISQLQAKIDAIDYNS
jgi:hypothetical protein